MKKIFLLVAVLTIIITTGFAQDSTVADSVVTDSGGSAISGVWDWIRNNWYIVLPALYEFIIRVVPTAKDWSALNLIKKMLDFLVPNAATKAAAKAAKTHE
jgi:hypothetical protein